MAEISLNGLGDLERLVSKLEASTTGANRRVGDAVGRVTKRGEDVAKANAPVDTGRLRSEIQGVATALSGLIVSRAPYSGFVNFGTSRQAPNEYMGRTASAIEPEFVKEITEAGKPDL